MFDIENFKQQVYIRCQEVANNFRGVKESPSTIAQVRMALDQTVQQMLMEENLSPETLALGVEITPQGSGNLTINFDVTGLWAERWERANAFPPEPEPEPDKPLSPGWDMGPFD